MMTGWFYAGGPMMWVLAVISISLLALAIERIIVFNQYRIEGGNTPTVVAFHKALANKDFDGAAFFGDRIVAAMEMRLDLISLGAKLATSAGLLGTILGMIDTLAAVGLTSGGVDMEALAAGLRQALITTATGLLLALPAQALHGTLVSIMRSRTERLTLLVEGQHHDEARL